MEVLGRNSLVVLTVYTCTIIRTAAYPEPVRCPEDPLVTHVDADHRQLRLSAAEQPFARSRESIHEECPLSVVGFV